MNSNNMKNYKQAIGKLKLSGDFNEKTAARLHTESEKIRSEVPIKRRKLIIKLCAAVATVIVITGGIIFDIARKDILLPNSSGVSARYVYITPMSRSSSQYDLAALSESEAIEGSDLIISGHVSSIRNIKVDFGGRFSEDWSIVTVDVETTFKGDVAAGVSISFLHHSPLASSSIWVEDNEVAGQMSIGSSAILFLNKYDEKDIFSENGNTLCLADLSEYGLPNGVQYAIVNTNNGLAYSDATYNLPAGASYNDAIAYIREITN